MMRRVITVWTLACMVVTQTTALAQPHQEGLAAGHAANPVIRGTITTPSATEHVPGYTTTPPERALSGQSSLTAPANARLAACDRNPGDPVCQAQRGAVSSANLPREGLSPDDPTLNAARAVTRNPGPELGGLGSYYTGCSTATTTEPAVVRERSCHRGELANTFATHRDLKVDVALEPNCVAGEWFAQTQVHRIPNVDVMHAQAQCRIRIDGQQRFRFYAHGSNGACIGWQELDLPTTPLTQPLYVAPLSPNWGRQGCWDNFGVVAMPGSGCATGNCRYQFQFGTLLYGCPSGSVSGDTLVADWGMGYVGPGSSGTCFSVQESLNYPCPEGTIQLQDGDAGLRCAVPTGSGSIVGAAGWEVPLAFDQPGMAVHATDAWVDRTPELPTGGRCTSAGEERCVDGPSTKFINGQPIHRACWRYERSVSCATGLASDACSALVTSGCTFARTVCERTDPVTGRCEHVQDVYRCEGEERTRTTVSNCPANVFCLGTSCFNTASMPDGDFARSMSMLEAGREAGVYLDTRNMQVFKGEASSCRNRFLTNCCDPDMSGASMTNQSAGIGRTRLVYDILTNSENMEFISAGLSALIGSAGFSGSFTTYGVTVAVNGTALPAGSSVLYSSTTAAGQGVVIAYDPWTLAIAVIILVVMQLMECNEQEARTALREGARLCHSVGSYCSTCIRVLGSCVSCTTRTTGKCCFNSVLARIINRQGRAQLGRGWGPAQAPDCSGFTVDELQRLDFGAMDLSEFYDSLVPSLPNQDGMRERNEERLRRCSTGQGACP